MTGSLARYSSTDEIAKDADDDERNVGVNRSRIEPTVGCDARKRRCGAAMACKDAAGFKKARASVASIISDGHRASEVITSLRALFQRDSAEKMLVDVNMLIRNVLLIERDELQRLGVSLRLELAETIAEVVANRTQLHQVILNLITNAIEAMSGTTGRARILHDKTKTSGAGVLVTVEDSGAGIDQENFDRIFEPFFTTKLNGMGLGLWICRTIIQNHNGNLTASPGVNHGSVFQISFPQRKANSE